MITPRARATSQTAIASGGVSGRVRRDFPPVVIASVGVSSYVFVRFVMILADQGRNLPEIKGTPGSVGGREDRCDAVARRRRTPIFTTIFTTAERFTTIFMTPR